MRKLVNFLVPGSILTTGAVFFLNSPYLSQVTRFQVDFGASILTLLCALLAWRFDRSRIIYLLQSLLYLDIATRYINGVQRESILILLVTVLLINLSFVALLKERGIHSLHGIFVISLPLIQSALLFYGINSIQDLTFLDIKTSFFSLPPPLSAVPEMILLTMIVALSIQIIRYLRYPTPLEGAMIWVILCVIATLFYPSGIQTTILLAASVLALFISFIETSYTLAYRDELTGIQGRRALMEAFNKLSGCYSIAMVDIDFFKKFNDKYGHDIGDQVLKMVAMRLARCGGGGQAFRYGGEEFCVLFSGKNVEGCLDYLEELRVSIGDQPFTIRKIARPVKKPKKPSKNKSKRDSVNVTVSIGVAEKTALYNQPEVVMKRADQALYRAKEAGRNKVSS